MAKLFTPDIEDLIGILQATLSNTTTKATAPTLSDIDEGSKSTIEELGPILNNNDQNKKNVSSGDQSIYKDGQEIESDNGEDADEHPTGAAADVVDREPIDTIPDKKDHDIIEYPIGAPQCYLCDKSVCDFGFKWHPREQFDADSHSNLLEERIIYLERIIEDHCAETRRLSDDVEAHGILLKQMQQKFGWRCGYAVSVRDELVPESKRDRGLQLTRSTVVSKRAKQIITFLSTHGVGWNSSGEVTINMKRIPQSSFVNVLIGEFENTQFL
ncbi:unnamed protein product [Allacma fusca]|uniref:Uncharacterized protein n=1 Tax=Allacma fusca TaxID=39272 RepID=A0A8J2NWQ3_9HEXA|nr:unnamed protein product [Allacma fusca]